MTLNQLMAGGLTDAQARTVLAHTHRTGSQPMYTTAELTFRSTVSNDVTRGANIKDSKFQERWAKLMEWQLTHHDIKPKSAREGKSGIGPIQYKPMDLAPTLEQRNWQRNRNKREMRRIRKALRARGIRTNSEPKGKGARQWTGSVVSSRRFQRSSQSLWSSL